MSVESAKISTSTTVRPSLPTWRYIWAAIRFQPWRYVFNILALASIAHAGFVKAGAGYLRKSMPPVELFYAEPAIDPQVHFLDPESAENLPVGVSGKGGQFVDLDSLKEFIGAADLYVTPYLNEAQITSGTLAYTFGSGKAVISTPYWHAQELLAEERGIIVPFADASAISKAAIQSTVYPIAFLWAGIFALRNSSRSRR